MVNVKKKKNIQTKPCRPSGLLSDLQLNSRESSDSVASSKTFLNSSKESRKSERTPAAKTSHDGTVKPEHRASRREDVVFVVNRNGKALMPTKSGQARRMLDGGIAKVVRKTPFTIKMLVETCEYSQTVDAGMDVGAKTIGVAARCGQAVLYAENVLLRQREIKAKLEQRLMYRRTRRGRKTRYRKARFLNRGSSIRLGRHQPSVKHVIEAHEREIKLVNSLFPTVRWHIETASFDIHAITNPEVSRWAYQKGRMLDFANVKAFVLSRDKYTCQTCGTADGNNKELHVHHIVFRSNGGADSPDNLVVLCKSCHDKLHRQKDAQDKSLKLKTKKQARTVEATIVSTVSAYLRNTFTFRETFGFETKEKRKILGFPKEHFIDALLTTCEIGEVVDFPTQSFTKRLVSQGDYQQTFGKHSEKKIPTGKLFGLRKFDLIETQKGTGFVKGKRSSGFFAISDIGGAAISDSVNVKKAVKRLSARKTVLIQRNSEAQFLLPLNEQVSLRRN